MNDSPFIPVITGPTASGKSSLALWLTQQFKLEIVSADAMMVYRGMDIGTAKPTVLERSRLPHHLIDVVSPDEKFSVANYVRLAETAIADILKRGKLPLLVGGTGFYIHALAQGLPTVPAAEPELQAELWQVFEQQGLESLQAELAVFSPKDASRAQRNPRRVIRALEIIRRSGKAPSEYPYTTPKFRYQKIALIPAIELLSERIIARTETMFAAGLLDEVKTLLKLYPERPTAIQAIGYKEVTAFLEGLSTLTEAKDAVNLATIQYAKRQRTWLRKEPKIRLVKSIAAEAKDEVTTWLDEVLKLSGF